MAFSNERKNKMRKVFLIFMLIMKISVCEAVLVLGKSNLNNNLVESPKDSLLNIHVIDPLISSYYYSYLRSPENIHELISYIEDVKTDQPNDTIFPWGYITEILLPVFKYYQDSLSIIYEYEEDIYSFAFQGNLISRMRISTFRYNPCNIQLLIGEHPSDYVNMRNRFDIFRYYDQRNKPVLEPVKFQEQLNEKIRELQISYLMPNQSKTFTYEDYTYPIYIVLEYRLSDGVRLFCENIPFHTHIEYFKKLEEYLKEFCEEHSLSRIVFLSPDYQ